MKHCTYQLLTKKISVLTGLHVKGKDKDFRCEFEGFARDFFVSLVRFLSKLGRKPFQHWHQRFRTRSFLTVITSSHLNRIRIKLKCKSNANTQINKFMINCIQIYHTLTREIDTQVQWVWVSNCVLHLCQWHVDTF